MYSVTDPETNPAIMAQFTDSFGEKKHVFIARQILVWKPFGARTRRPEPGPGAARVRYNLLTLTSRETRPSDDDLTSTGRVDA